MITQEIAIYQAKLERRFKLLRKQIAEHYQAGNMMLARLKSEDAEHTANKLVSINQFIYHHLPSLKLPNNCQISLPEKK